MLDQTEASTGPTSTYILGPEFGSEVVPSGGQPDLLFPARVVRLDTQYFEIGRGAGGVVPSVIGECRTILERPLIPEFWRVVGPVSQITIKERILWRGHF